MGDENNKKEEPKKDKFIYYTILIAAIIVALFFMIGLFFVDSNSLEILEQTVTHMKGSPVSGDRFLIAIFVVPIIFLIIYCIKEIRKK